jgi:hypothetical protein
MQSLPVLADSRGPSHRRLPDWLKRDLPRGTEQKPHGRVQTLPRIMNVAVRWA